ncbi:adipokinetic hormone/corazonin-related peptide receptor variant I-like [Penaeus indicus]|uniref:adipokinetic hormone/corazonin-related peptide receptor variant I-like n=1 Tax=Penaeus indicus TaxID=29960 RepID=UPI00300BFA65
MDASTYSELGHKGIRMASYLDPFVNSSDSLRDSFSGLEIPFDDALDQNYSSSSSSFSSSYSPSSSFPSSSSSSSSSPHFAANLSRVAEEEESHGNQSLPIDMRFNDGHILLISCYSGIFIVSLVGNLCVLKAILGGGRKQRKSRVNLMLLHLAIADLIVTTIMIPVEVGWSATVQWMAGDTFCRVFAFFRIFGHYLSSFILVCISIDRYFAVVYPLSLNAADRRGKIMLTFAWFLAFTCSLPQVVIFHVEKHPDFTFYVQCVTFNFYPSSHHEMVYHIFCLVMLYVAPLSIIIISYGAIVITIFQKSRLSDGNVYWRISVMSVSSYKVRSLMAAPRARRGGGASGAAGRGVVDGETASGQTAAHVKLVRGKPHDVSDVLLPRELFVDGDAEQLIVIDYVEVMVLQRKDVREKLEQVSGLAESYPNSPKGKMPLSSRSKYSKAEFPTSLVHLTSLAILKTRCTFDVYIFVVLMQYTAIRRSSLGYLGRARARTIKMTISIVLAFFVCWTPYVVISLWFCFDRSAAELLDVKVQKGLFFFACTNSCVNPIVYGIFNFCKKKQPIQTQTWRSTTLNTQINSRGFECRSFKSSRVYWGRREQESTATNSEATDHTAELLLPRTLNSSFRARSHSGSESATSIHLQTLGSTSSMSRRQIAERNNSGSSPLTTQYRNGSYYSAPSKSRCHEENGNPV